LTPPYVGWCQLTQEHRYELADQRVRALVQLRRADSTQRLTLIYMV